jgi:uncharacterized protein YecE (DUF72 family)
MSGAVRIGCGSWGRAGLEAYARQFNSVEVNATFYKLASLETVRAWVAQTPDDFEFSIKASRYMTHKWRLRDTERLSRSFYEPLEPLVEAGKMGPTLWQLPGNFRRDDERLAGALAVLPPGRHCFEFRHESWFCDEVTQMLREKGVARVVGDHPQRRFQSHEPTADWMVVRFLHGTRGRRGNYSETELDEWAQRLGEWRERGDVYAYFNNDGDGPFALPNARGLRERLG